MFESYRVTRGDTLSSIAQKYNTSVKVLQDLNNLYYIELIVPKESKDYFNYYVVEKGDNLYAIARKYNINPELLASLNGLKNDDYIYPNQTILIPKSNYSYYITAEGDTMDEVIKVFNTTKDKFLDENKTIYLMEGQLLVNKK